MKEAMKLALEALEEATIYTNSTSFSPSLTRECKAAATALREALAEQPAQQEPVAVHQFRKRGCSDWYDGHPDHTDGGGPYEARTLYTSPPARNGWTTEQIAGMARLKEAQDKKLSQRTWVGLTNEQIDKLFGDGPYVPAMLLRNVARAIEAKLKEKNT